MRRDHLSRLPNLITGTRLIFLPVLWFLAVSGAARWLGVGIAVAAATDVIDGVLARWLDSRSETGSRFDSVADHLLTASVLLWLVMLRPELVTAHLPLLGVWAAFGGFTLAVGWTRFRRIGDLHLYSAKAAGFLSYLLVVYLLIFDAYSPTLVNIAITGCFIATGETLIVYLTRKDPTERIGSILLRPKR